MTEEKQIKQDEPVVKKEINVNIPAAEELLAAGVHFGHKTSRWNPKMENYIFGVKNGGHVFDLGKTVIKLKEAAEFAANVAAKGGMIIFVGTKPSVKKLFKEAAQSCGMFYVSERWLGGTLTNFKTISKRIEYYRDLEKKTAEGELKKYTKKEQLGFARQLKNLEINFIGIKNLNKLPEAVFVADLKENISTVREAKKAKVKVIAICDTNTDPTLVDYPIPANDDAASAVKIIVETIAGAIKENKQ